MHRSASRSSLIAFAGGRSSVRTRTPPSWSVANTVLIGILSGIAGVPPALDSLRLRTDGCGATAKDAGGTPGVPESLEAHLRMFGMETRPEDVFAGEVERVFR